MKTTTDIYKFDTLSISGSYLPAIVNYDYSGMTLEELKPLDDFFMDIRNIIQRRHPDEDISYLLVMAGEPQEPSFELCAVSGLYSECYEVDVMVHAKNKA